MNLNPHPFLSLSSIFHLSTSPTLPTLHLPCSSSPPPLLQQCGKRQPPLCWSINCWRGGRRNTNSCHRGGMRRPSFLLQQVSFPHLYIIVFLLTLKLQTTRSNSLQLLLLVTNYYLFRYSSNQKEFALQSVLCLKLFYFVHEFSDLLSTELLTTCLYCVLNSQWNAWYIVFYCIRMHVHGVHSNVSVMLSWAYYCINCVEKNPITVLFYSILKN